MLKAPLEHLGPWRNVLATKKERAEAMRKVVGALPKRLGDIHSTLLASTRSRDGGASNTEENCAVDLSENSQASRVAELKDAKLIRNPKTALNCFEVSTLMLFRHCKPNAQRQLNEAHVEKLMVRFHLFLERLVIEACYCS